MGRLRLSALVAALCAATVVAAAQAAAPATVLRLPDLVPEEPSDLSLRLEHGAGGSRVLLGFDAASLNTGSGPLVVEGRRRPGAPAMSVAQLVVRRDGRPARRRPAVATLRYVTAPDHRHWHLQDFMRYELRRASDGSLVRPDLKTGFCLGDRYPRPGTSRLPRYTSQCGLGRPGLRRLRQGISSGFGDAYGAFLEGQAIDVTGVPAGEYALVHRVNPLGRLAEERYDNNVRCVAITLGPPDGGPPTLAHRSAERCPAGP